MRNSVKSRLFLPIRSLAPTALASLLAAACGSAPAPSPAPAVPSEPAAPAMTESAIAKAAAAVDELYDELEAQTARFDEGLEMILADERGAGEAQLASAAAAIRGLTDLCLQQPGCDSNRPFTTYDYLLDRQRSALVDLHVHLDQLEPLLVEPEDRRAVPIGIAAHDDGHLAPDDALLDDLADSALQHGERPRKPYAHLEVPVIHRRRLDVDVFAVLPRLCLAVAGHAANHACPTPVIGSAPTY